MMKFFHFILGLLLVSTILVTNSACKKKLLFADGNLAFSTDTLVFDTVFTTIGSTTKQFKIYNPQKRTLKIDQVQLMGGNASPFKLNLDGLKGTLFTDLELEKGDSLFCFVEVKLNVNGQNYPVVIEDSIRFRTNGEDQYVKLVVWGQDMYYHYSTTGNLDINEGTWPNDKPHLIYNRAYIDSAKTLNIVAGTKIYLHKNAMLFNYKGTLNIDGDYNNKVVFQGDRLESFYKDVPGQYYGIYMHEARPSMIDNVVIKNATAGIHMDSRDPNYSLNTLTISNTEIFNVSSYGLFLYNGAKVYGENVLVHSVGVHALLVIQGAEFTFNHCNFLGYGTGDGSTPTVGISNKYTNSQGTFVGSIPTGNFTNCVIYGNANEQLAFDTLTAPGVTLNFNFTKCVIKRSNLSSTIFNGCSNGNPAFTNPSSDDFKFTSTSSSLSNNGLGLGPGIDLNGTPRDPVNPDIGVYELQ